MLLSIFLSSVFFLEIRGWEGGVVARGRMIKCTTALGQRAPAISGQPQPLCPRAIMVTPGITGTYRMEKRVSVWLYFQVVPSLYKGLPRKNVYFCYLTHCGKSNQFFLCHPLFRSLFCCVTFSMYCILIFIVGIVYFRTKFLLSGYILAWCMFHLIIMI